MSRKRFLRLMGLWPKGSEETVDGAFGTEGCGRLTAAGCVRFAQGATAAVPQRVVEAPYGRKYKVSVTGLAFVSSVLSPSFRAVVRAGMIP